MLLAQRSETLLLGDRVDVRANDEGDNIEKGNPGSLRQELLGKSKAEGRSDPGDLHDLPEANAHGGPNLVVGSGTGDQRHGRQIDGVLHGGNL